MGDDWPDLGALAMAGLAVTVPNAHHEVRRRVHLVTQASGGRGAVRELCDVILHAKGTYDELLARFLAVRGD
jgi:3-deoxy-D-manno-octulosonate 8-phosphate phosphatase (KDO 8-P phosphatase)